MTLNTPATDPAFSSGTLLAATPNPHGAEPKPPATKRRLKSRFGMASQDIADSFKLWRLATKLGWLDVRLQFSGSTLGPFWLTLTTAIMIAAMGMIYSQLFHLTLKDYLPYLSISMILWQNGLSSLVQESCSTFTRAADSIRSVTMPYTVQALRTTIRCGLILGYTVIVPIVVFIVFGVWPGSVVLLAVPAIALWLFNSVAWCLLLGTVGARFRDVPPIVGSILQILFYVTPIIWEPKQLKDGAWWLYFNPFYSLFEIVRRPFLGQVPTETAWIISLGFSATLSVIAFISFARSRSRLAFWV